MCAVLFDLYDTLVRTEWPLLRERLAGSIGLTPQEVMHGFVVTREARGVGTYGSPEGDLAAVLRAAGGQPTDEQIAELTVLEMRALIEHGIHVYEDAVPVLRELRTRRVPTGVVSNCDHWTRPVVDALGLEDLVDAVVLSFEVGVMKPDPAIYRIALERMGVGPEETTFVDDQPAYLDGARAIGMQALHIIRPTDPNPMDPELHPVIEDLWAVVPPA